MDINFKTVRIGDLLKSRGLVTEDQIGQALAYQKEHKGVRLGNALIEMGFIRENQLLEALAEQLHVEVVEISNLDVDVDAVTRIPRALAEKYEMLAVGEREGNLKVVLYDPLDFYGLEDIRQVTGMGLELALSSRAALKNAIGYYYNEVEARQAANIANESFAEIGDSDEFDIDEEGDDDTPIINLLNRLVSRAYTTNASDIHIEPFEDKTVVRMRIDGIIVEYVTLKKSLHPSLIARIKILGGMDIAERRIPQDGHFRIKVGSDPVNLRVSVLPTVFGEKAVLRLLASNSAIDYPDTFGMQPDDYVKLKTMMESPNGIVYITGPTGSGKSTTLYMILAFLSKKPVNISTIEDPVERNLAKINQTQVNAQAGLTFEAGLRALLRQDPDIIMVGETRDAETATISVRSAITGHMVFSTLHTNDAASSVVRLEDMGLAPYMVANSVVGIIAQRLMRKLCPDCCEEREATYEEVQFLDGDPNTIFAYPKIKVAKGCPQCNYTGYRGRVAIHEVLMVDREMREMIINGASSEALKDYAVEKQGMHTLKEAGVKMVKDGISTIDELKKVAFAR